MKTTLFPQVIDTPGILDRDFEDRNKTEMQAITALAYIRAAILYVMDPSEQCGKTLEQQVRLPSYSNKNKRIQKDIVTTLHIYYTTAVLYLMGLSVQCVGRHWMHRYKERGTTELLLTSLHEKWLQLHGTWFPPMTKTFNDVCD